MSPARRRTIRVTFDLRDVVDAAEAAIGSDPGIAQRAGRLVVVRGGDDENRRRAVIQPLRAATLRERLTAVATWERRDGRAKGYVPCLPTGHVIHALLARGEWPSVRSLPEPGGIS